MGGNIRLPQIGTAKVEIDGNGTLQSLALRQLDVHGDSVEASASGELAWSDSVGFAGSVVLDKLDPYGLIPAWPQDFPLAGQATGQWTARKIGLSNFRLAVAGTEIRLSAAGDIDIADRSVNGNLNWQHFRWPLDSGAAVVSRAGDLNISGDLSAWNADGLITLQTYGYPEGALTLKSAGDKSSVKVTILDSNVLQGSVSGEASYNWRGIRSFNLSLQLDNIQPNSLFPEWPGVLGGFVEIAGTQQPLAIDLDLDALDGSIRGQEFAAEGGMSFSPGAVSFRNFSRNASVHRKLRCMAIFTIQTVWNTACNCRTSAPMRNRRPAPCRHRAMYRCTLYDQVFDRT